MDDVRIIEIKQGIFDENAREADELRARLKRQGSFLLNLMSSPGSGKTTLLKRTVSMLPERFSVAVMEADIDSDVDARAIAETGTEAIQLHTGGMCHLDAAMCAQGLEALSGTPDLIVLENVGNLVCPAEFDTGASKNAMILSVPEGDDKPLKYPLMFEVADVVVVNKMDACSVFDDFSLERLEANVRRRNKSCPIIPLSAKTGEGADAWSNWLTREIDAWKE